jgi:perosamine synthetase
MLTPHPTLRRSDLFSGCRNDLRALGDGDSLYLTYNARGALYQLLQAIPENQGSVVLLPAFHCTALVEPVAHSRFRAAFYRIKPDLSIDYDDLRSKATSNVAVIVAIHFFGFPADLSPLLELRQQLGCYLLEDCAHSFLTVDGGRPIGHRGDFSIFSFYKTVPSLFGGALRINHKPFQFTPSSNSISWKESAVISKRLFEQIIENSSDGFGKRSYQSLENRRLSRKKSAPAADQPSASNFVDDPYLFRADLAKARIPWSCRSILRSSDWQAFVAARRRNYALLNVALKENNVLSRVFTCLPEGVCPWAYPVLLQDRTQHDQELRARGVPLFTFGEVLHPLLAQSDSSVRKDAQDLSNRLMLLPVHQNLSVDDVTQYADEINRFLAGFEPNPVESHATDAAPQPLTSRGCL